MLTVNPNLQDFTTTGNRELPAGNVSIDGIVMGGGVRCLEQFYFGQFGLKSESP
uniref:Bm13559 n=1 Tax=Brugia malayi TaxID=6279 RepID=A0A1I9G2L4_BRUMA|nr:Bm13559 [Brugia malayi]